VHPAMPSHCTRSLLTLRCRFLYLTTRLKLQPQHMVVCCHACFTEMLLASLWYLGICSPITMKRQTWPPQRPYTSLSRQPHRSLLSLSRLSLWKSWVLFFSTFIWAHFTLIASILIIATRTAADDVTTAEIYGRTFSSSIC
jgi:hypothetical protein